MSLSEAKRKPKREKKPVYTDNSGLSDSLEFNLNNEKVHIKMNGLRSLKNLGEGQFSNVYLMEDTGTKLRFAVKMCHNIADDVMKDILNDINIGKSFSSKFKIDYYGGLKDKFDIWILMEPMDISVKKFYRKIQEADSGYRFPGIVLGYFAFCSVQVLEDLHLKNVIHRDVKPSNMLVNKAGTFKLCDFGISGKLKDSLVQSAVGTNAYLAPERIAPLTHGEPYSIIADVWSLGLSILEIAEMQFPFASSQSLMNQLNEIVINPPPKLSTTSPYHQECPELNEFIMRTLARYPTERYRYVDLKSLKLISPFNDESHFNRAQDVLSKLVIQYVNE